MKKVFLLVVIMFFMSWSQAFADYTFTFTSNDASLSASGTLYTTSNGDGSFTVTGGFITGTFGDAILLAATTGTSPGNWFYYDSLLSPASLPMLSFSGLLFTAGSTVNGDYREINLYGNGTAPNDYSLIQQGQAIALSDDLRGTFTVTPIASSVPIPGALLLFGPGLAGLAILRKRLKK